MCHHHFVWVCQVYAWSSYQYYTNTHNLIYFREDITLGFPCGLSHQTRLAWGNLPIFSRETFHRGGRCMDCCGWRCATWNTTTSIRVWVTLPKFNMVHLKMAARNRRSFLETTIFRFHVKLGECRFTIMV